MSITEIWNSLDEIKYDIISVSCVAEAVKSAVYDLDSSETMLAISCITKNLNLSIEEIDKLVRELIRLQRIQGDCEQVKVQ